MVTKSKLHNDELDDSLKQHILRNELCKSLALDCASYFINESSDRLRLNADLPYTPIIVAAHALIAHKEWQHDIDRDRLLDVITPLNQIHSAISELSEAVKDIADSIDCSGERAPVFWMISHEAAKDKAKEIGIDVPVEWTVADLRYKLHQAIYGGEHG